MFITNAYAQSASTGFFSGGLIDYLPILLMFVVLYFLMIRPQQKRMKEQKLMMDALSQGDEVVTSGGILGVIVRVADNIVTLQIAVNVEVMVQKGAVVTLLPKGTVNLSGKTCSIDNLPSSSCCG